MYCLGRDRQTIKKYEFGDGEYVQVSVDLEPKNSQLLRSIDAIYLMPLDCKQGVIRSWTLRQGECQGGAIVRSAK